MEEAAKRRRRMLRGMSNERRRGEGGKNKTRRRGSLAYACYWQRWLRSQPIWVAGSKLKRGLFGLYRFYRFQLYIYNWISLVESIASFTFHLGCWMQSTNIRQRSSLSRQIKFPSIIIVSITTLHPCLKLLTRRANCMNFNVITKIRRVTVFFFFFLFLLCATSSHADVSTIAGKEKWQDCSKRELHATKPVNKVSVIAVSKKFFHRVSLALYSSPSFLCCFDEFLFVLYMRVRNTGQDGK